MTNIALLNNVDHHDLRVAFDDWAAFGAQTNQVPLSAAEIDDAQRDYPIILRRDEAGAYHPVALLGLDRDENLFLDADGWGARYVPAVLQRGPFRIGPPPQAGGEPMIHIDLDDPAVSRDRGAPLFLEHGGNAPYLDHVMRVLQRLHIGSEIGPALFAALDEAGLIEEVTLRISLDETTRYDVPDAFSIGGERLAALDGATLERLNRAGFLRPAFMIAASLANVPRLIERKNARRAAAP